MSNMDEVLAKRGKTHGDFSENANLAQEIKHLMKKSRNWSKLDDVTTEALEMVACKIARLLSGDYKEIDHYEDISGYCLLVVKELKKAEKPELDGLVTELTKELRGKTNVKV